MSAPLWRLFPTHSCKLPRHKGMIIIISLILIIKITMIFATNKEIRILRFQFQ